MLQELTAAAGVTAIVLAGRGGTAVPSAGQQCLPAGHTPWCLTSPLTALPRSIQMTGVFASQPYL